MSEHRRENRRRHKHRSRPTSNRSIRNSVWFHRYGPVRKVPCCWCGKMLTFNESTLEHLTPVSEGGTNNWDNLDIACLGCNSGRQHWEEKKQRELHSLDR